MKFYAKYIIALVVTLSILFSFEINAQRKSSFVRPYITRKGKFVSGHYRKSYNLKPNAYKSRIRSKVYYYTKGKYLRKLRW
jgi:hypothetical protein